MPGLKLAEPKLTVYMFLTLDSLEKQVLSTRQREVYRLLSTRQIGVTGIAKELKVGHPRIVHTIHLICRKVYEYCDYASVLNFRKILDLQKIDKREHIWKKFKHRRRGYLVLLEKQQIRILEENEKNNEKTPPQLNC